MPLNRRFKNYIAKVLRKIFSKEPKDFKKIPIIINNFNRLTTLKHLIIDLEERGYHNIHIIDNLSKYRPLLEYYKTTPHKVYRLSKNQGYKALWKSGLWIRFMSGYFVYTDSDINLASECPANFLEHFFNILKKYPKSHKVGFSLKINDIPDFYFLKDKVIKWEKQFYLNKIEKDLFIAPIDTTFALYRPFSKKGDADSLMFRTNFPYQSKHMPWYVDTNNLPSEEKYYIKSTNQSNWAIK